MHKVDPLVRSSRIQLLASLLHRLELADQLVSGVRDGAYSPDLEETSLELASKAIDSVRRNLELELHHLRVWGNVPFGHYGGSHVADRPYVIEGRPDSRCACSRQRAADRA